MQGSLSQTKEGKSSVRVSSQTLLDGEPTENEESYPASLDAGLKQCFSGELRICPLNSEKGSQSKCITSTPESGAVMAMVGTSDSTQQSPGRARFSVLSGRTRFSVLSGRERLESSVDNSVLLSARGDRVVVSGLE